MCADTHLPTNKFSDLIAELPGSYARLNRNQTRAGYTVLFAKRHAVELHDLTDDELLLFRRDVAAVGRTLTAPTATSTRSTTTTIRTRSSTSRRARSGCRTTSGTSGSRP
jgi:diadenosine tetraphosphate (Ap4A) HIT family hydrolase